MSCKDCEVHKTCIDAFQPHSQYCGAYGRKESDYIKREDAIEAVRKAYVDYIPILFGRAEEIPLEVDMALENLPSADVVEHKRGEWIDKGWHGDWQFEIDGRGNCWHEYECSECGFHNKGGEINYCPNCGARMKGADDEID